MQEFPRIQFVIIFIHAPVRAFAKLVIPKCPQKNDKVVYPRQ